MKSLRFFVSSVTLTMLIILSYIVLKMDYIHRPEASRVPRGKIVDNRQHFVILSTARSGSTLLMDLLANHDYISCQGEPLNRGVLSRRKLNCAKKDDILNHIRETVDKESKPMVGFKILLEHLSDNGLTMGDVLGLLNNPKVIVLYRPNLLETYVSLQIGLRNHKWYSAREANNISVEINREKFLRYAEDWREMWKSTMAQVDDFVRPADRTIVTYDQICYDRNRTVQDLFSFLGLRKLRRKLKIKGLKQNPGRLQDKIENYDSISDLIIDGYESFRLSF